MRWSEDRPLAQQTALAQLFQSTRQIEQQRSIAGLKGSFSSRTVHGKAYWYYQFLDSVTGRNQQIFLGQDSEAIQRLKQAKADVNQKTKQLGLRRQIRMARAAGADSLPRAHFGVIRQLADYGFFHAGGVLVGSHAFSAFANLLGVTWQGTEFTQTLDVDFAHAGRNISVALPADLKIDTTSAIASLEGGFLPQITGGGRGGTWQHSADVDFLIDFLTPQTSDSDAPFEHEPLGIALQPLRFMEFSLENIQQTVLFDASSYALVNVPDPARYALHKLIVYVERRDRLKAQKDLKQSAALLEVLKRDRPDDLLEAWQDLQARGPGWRQRAQMGLAAMQAQLDEPSFIEWVTQYQTQVSDDGDKPPRWRN